MQYISTITQKGQATIPAPIRKKLGLGLKGRVLFEVKDDMVFVKASPDFFAMKGSIKSSKKPLTDVEMDNVIAQAVSDDYAETLKRMK